MNIVTKIVNKLHQRLNRYSYRGGNYFCPTCKQSVRYFNRLPDENFRLLDKYQFIHPFFSAETINHLKYTCPNCRANDRSRLYALYFDTRLPKDGDKKFRLLDIAPAKGLREYLKSAPSLIYRSADLYAEGVDDQVDVTDMHIYKEGQFDIILCSHVLEHVNEDVKAMRELYRVMKKGGWGIIMVPILLSIKEDYQPAEVVTEADRWKHFGQGDHVRMYSKNGFVVKLESAGFKVNQYGTDFFGAENFERSGIHHRSVLYVVEKQ